MAGLRAACTHSLLLVLLLLSGIQGMEVDDPFVHPACESRIQYLDYRQLEDSCLRSFFATCDSYDGACYGLTVKYLQHIVSQSPEVFFHGLLCHGSACSASCPSLIKKEAAALQISQPGFESNPPLAEMLPRKNAADIEYTYRTCEDIPFESAVLPSAPTGNSVAEILSEMLQANPSAKKFVGEFGLLAAGLSKNRFQLFFHSIGFALAQRGASLFDPNLGELLCTHPKAGKEGVLLSYFLEIVAKEFDMTDFAGMVELVAYTAGPPGPAASALARLTIPDGLSLEVASPYFAKGATLLAEGPEEEEFDEIDESKLQQQQQPTLHHIPSSADSLDVGEEEEEDDDEQGSAEEGEDGLLAALADLHKDLASQHKPVASGK